MGRIAAVLTVSAAVLAPGCASSEPVSSRPVAQIDAGRGPLSKNAVTRPATATCGRDGTPPVPRIRARLHGERIRVEYEVLARPDDCRPVAIHVTAHSVVKLGNIAPGKGAGGPVPLDGDSGVIVLKVPPLDLPPYEALASTNTARGLRSDTTYVPVPQRGDYCRRHSSASVCIARAQAAFMKCLRGQLPRSRCVGWIWNTRPLIPYEPLVGVTEKTLERSFVYVSGRIGGDPPFKSLSCTGLRMCVATWQGGHPAKVFRARYEVSSYGQRSGCWIAERRAILEETPPPEHIAPLRHVIPERISGCIDWVR